MQALAEGQALDRDMCRKLVDELLQAEASPDLQHRAGLICLVMVRLIISPTMILPLLQQVIPACVVTLGHAH